MEPGVIGVVALAVIGCGTGIVLRIVSVLADGRRRALEHQLQLAQEMLRHREERIAELERMNHQLELQVDWHVKLLGSPEKTAR